MKKIDKSTILSSNYKEWLDSLGEEHPKYNSSNNKYYNDIKMSLLYCQKGLCAYTEELLCDLDLITKDNWDDEKYITDLKEKDLVNGDLEHFDESIKRKQAWLWDNLFFVQGDINRKIKCSKSIQEILKPDAPHYDPNIYLEFDYKRNRFIANSNLDIKVQEDVDCMIITLGLNANAFKRKRQIKKLVEALKYDIELEEPHEYITSWNMTLKQLKENNNA
ncbi:hypothetical protein MNB_SV-9-511 [hydrothermal vent metagenome]|uniref:Uncharacterized protein n=1 Tax=hydrothermal vent metagenome TaxID=652676 RepID=A0A1W1BWS8_9ZZZZ